MADLEKLLSAIPHYDDDRCLCEGCQVVYVRDLLAGKDAGICDCGCYPDSLVTEPKEEKNIG